MKHLWQFTLYLETDVSGAPPDRKALGELIALEAMAALPVALLTSDAYAVRMLGAEIIYRGHRVAQPARQGAARRRTSSRRLLLG